MEAEPVLHWWHSRNNRPLSDLILEELLLDEAGQGSLNLLTYAWAGPVLVLGYGQNPEGVVDLDFCGRKGIPVLRRSTGGTAVYHHGALSLCLCLPASHPWAQGIQGLYDAFVGSVRAGLAAAGIRTERPAVRSPSPTVRSPICFEDHRTETLLLGGRKVLGCAQARRSRSVLVHGTLLFRLDAEVQARIFGVPAARIEAAMGALPRPSPEGADSLAPALARRIASDLASPLKPEPALPPLPPGSDTRETDPRWVIVP
ncbi:MAG: hypothetical protein WBS54_07885 [Acidobacteriota bacterium]